jgi:hypothetical protein
MAEELGLDVVREPHFSVRVPGAEGGRDLFLDVLVGLLRSSSLTGSNVEGFAPRGAGGGAGSGACG